MSLTARRSRRWIAIGTAAIAALSIASSANAAAPGGLDIPGTVLRSGDFNTGGLSQWSGYQRVSAYSLQVLPSPVREGSHAARFEVRRGDDPLCQAGWGCYGDRSEVQMSTGEVEGQERWYSWSTMFAPDFPSYTSWQVFSQWHSKKDGAPPLAFYVNGDSLVLQANRNDGTNFLSYDKLWTGPIRRGQWQDIRLHVKWSGSDSIGFVELWIDGVPQTLTNGSTRRYVRTMYPGYGNYFKQGYYRQSGLAATGVVYHDGFRMSDGQGAMTSPPPPPSSSTPPPPSSSTPAPSVSITPTSASVAVGTTKQFAATVANTTAGVTWSVNGVVGGNATVGTVSTSGLYRAPAAVPSGGTVSVKATSSASPTASATATVGITAPSAAPAPAPAPVSGTALFSDGFETVSPGTAGSPWTLRLDSGNRFSWSTAFAASGARSAGFEKVSGAGNMAYITRAIPSGQGDVSVTARVYLRSNTLPNGRARSLMRVVRGDGRVAGPRHEMGIYRTAEGKLRWAVWSADKDGRYAAATLGTETPVLGRWTTVTLRTQWNRADARARLGIAGGEAFSGAPVDLAGTTPSHVDVGNAFSRSADPAVLYFDEVTVTDAGIAATTASRVRNVRVKVPASSRAPKRRSARR